MATRKAKRRAQAKVTPRAAAAAPDPEPVPVPVPVPEATAEADMVRLEGGLSIRDVRDLHARLRAAAEAGRIRIDAGAVTQVDSAVLQLLVSAAHTLTARGARLEFAAASAALREAATRADLARALGFAHGAAAP